MFSLAGPCLILLAVTATQDGSDPAGLDPMDIPSPPHIQVDALAGAWLARLGGTVTLGPGNGTIDVATQFDIDALEPSLNLELAVRSRDQWVMTFGGTAFSTSTSGNFAGVGDFGSISLTNGDPFTSSFEITTVFADIAFCAWRPFTSSPQRIEEYENRSESGRFLANLRISPLVGGRFIDVDQTVRVTGNREDAGGEWLNLYAGLDVTLDYRPELTLFERLRLQALLGMGPAIGEETGWAWQVRAGVSVHLTESLGIMVGYRLLELDVENDGYAFDGGLQGLFLAGSLRF